MDMLSIAIERDAIRVGDRFTVRFERTLRVPDDGSRYPLPPGLGHLPVHRVEEYADRVPAAWREAGGVFISLYQAEALWLSFQAAPWKPNAVTVGVGRVNAISSGAWPGTLDAAPQNYLVCPPQLWLDGLNAGDRAVRQFVAMPLGRGATVEGQISGVETHGGLQIRVYDPKPGRFPDEPPPDWHTGEAAGGPGTMAGFAPMGFAPGGQIEQTIRVDAHGLETWDQSVCATLLVHVVNSTQYHAITGHEAPPSPIDARTYTEYGFPWFRLYDEGADVPAADALAGLTSIADLADPGASAPDAAAPVDIPPSHIIGLRRPDPGRGSRNGD
jgi:hypothetical protein